MIQIASTQVTPKLRSLFRTDAPQVPRCFNVLDGNDAKGKILTDHIDNPTWGAVWESYDGSLYWGGDTDREYEIMQS